MDYDLLENLLFEDEGAALDFKREQYQFQQSTIEKKAELLKDILAFANSWRRTDAYILIGVEEVKGKRSNVCGVQSHLDDASLQQFVNSKTNRPVNFRYRAREHDGLQVGIVEIPLQKRPTYLTKQYGKLKPKTVYIRRGSSTDEAPPEEVARMGASDSNSSPTPQFDMQFGRADESALYGSTCEIECDALDLPNAEEIPTYGRSMNVAGTLIPVPSLVNPQFYKEYADYLYDLGMLQRVQLVIENGDVPLTEAVIRFSISKDTGFVVKSARAQKPSKQMPTSNLPTFEQELTVEGRKTSWEVNLGLGNVHPKDVRWSPTLYFGANRTSELTIEASVYAKNLPEPVTIPLTINAEVKNVALSVDALVDLANGKNLEEK